jgi:hypothetical protein
LAGYSSASYADTVLRNGSFWLSGVWLDAFVEPWIAEFADASKVISGFVYFIEFHLLSLLNFSAEISFYFHHAVVFLFVSLIGRDGHVIGHTFCIVFSVLLVDFY